MNYQFFVKWCFLTCMLCSTLRKSFIPVRCWTSWKMATSRVGVMAIERVSNTRANLDHLRFRKPWKNIKVKPWASSKTTCFRTSPRLINHSSSYLHDKLPRVSACHCGTLSSRQDPDRPDIEGRWAEETPEDNSLKKDYDLTGFIKGGPAKFRVRYFAVNYKVNLNCGNVDYLCSCINKTCTFHST